jgi:hypothetical protein
MFGNREADSFISLREIAHKKKTSFLVFLEEAIPDH